jgi:hypothetical protein
MLNIITRKVNAAEIARRGARRASRPAFSFLAAIPQRGRHAAYPAI